jgi:hypothetical protein
MGLVEKNQALFFARNHGGHLKNLQTKGIVAPQSRLERYAVMQV